ncbi:MAG: PAS domain S-box protein [Deltaproteobacteria bacterium]|nr:PAS domain S-box protein [Deltaproteobacteria bacterium]
MQTTTSTRIAAAHLLANRVPPFAGTWLVVVALITLIETLQGRLRFGLALAFLAGHLAIVGGAVLLRSAAHARAIVIALCGGLAASITGTFASFGGSAEILGVMLFALSASAAAFFVWGWEPQLALNAITATLWLLALPHLGVSTSPLELVGITVIGWVITLGLAESMRRTFEAGLVLRAREREAVDALQKSYDAYRDLAENARDFIWTADLQGRLTYLNQATARLLGDTPNALIGRATSEFLTDHPDNLDVAATFARVAAGETVPPLAAECATALGRRWLEVIGTRIRDHDGRVVGIRVTGRDITERRAAEEERRHAEQALHESEARYRGLVESTQAVFTRLDREGRILFANDAICRVIGLPLDAMLGQSLFQWVHPDDLAATRASMAAVMEPPHRVLVENRVPAPNGWRWFEWEGSAIVEADGSIREFQSIGLDVTERKEAEHALQASEARYRSLVESGLELIARADPSGKLLFANDAYLCAFGYRREDVEAGRVTILPHIHEEDRARVLASFAHVLQPPYRNVVVSRVRIGGTWRRFEWEQGVVRDERGAITEIQGAGRDVTERHVAEEALRRSLEDLKRSEETLRRLARRQAAIREEERRRLGLDLHDNVCQELAAIGVLLEVSRAHERDSAELAQATRHLAEVIEHLRMVSRELRPMMLSDLGLMESLRAFATNASSLQRSVTTRFPTPIPRLDDETEIAVYRVAQESLGNALRHAAARTVDLLLRVDDGRLLLEVRDDGRGFDRATSRSDSLGLASMEERALALGGRLEIVSDPGRGTCVRLECPVTVRSPATAA